MNENIESFFFFSFFSGLKKEREREDLFKDKMFEYSAVCFHTLVFQFLNMRLIKYVYVN